MSPPVTVPNDALGMTRTVAPMSSVPLAVTVGPVVLAPAVANGAAMPTDASIVITAKVEPT